MWFIAAVIVTMVGIWLTLRLNGPTTDIEAQDATAAQRTLDVLAARVEAVWKPEQSRRRLLNPRPLPTAWTTIGPPVCDHWANIRADGINEPLDLSGLVDLANPDAFQQVVTDPRLRSRIVLLGDPGAGKTALLIRLTLALLAARSRQNHDDRAAAPALLPVPALLRLTTWNPAEQTLHQWVHTRLEADYGQRHPVATAHLMPLLDGLDEMPEHRRKQALLAISNTFTDTPLVLTSRTTEYLDALTTLAGSTLAAAAVLELTALRPETVRQYLELTTSRPVDWAHVFTRDATDHDGRLAASLSAPLWVDLARTTYTDPDQSDNDPSELLLLPDADTVRARLLDRLISSAYPEPDDPDADGRTGRRVEAYQRLQHLAADMRQRDTQDIAWWNLALTVPRTLRAMYGFAAVLATGLVFGLHSGLTFGLAYGLVAGIAVGLGIRFEKPSPPSRRPIQKRRTDSPLLFRLAAGLAYGLALGLLGGLTIGLVIGAADGLTVGRTEGFTKGLTDGLWKWSEIGPAFGVAFWLVFGFGAGFVIEFTTLFRVRDVDVRAATDPLGLLRGDRRRAITGLLAFGLTAGLTVGLTSGMMNGGASDLLIYLFGITEGLTVGFVYALGFGAWGRFGLARLWWCGHGWLPWRTMAFLSDAHRRGVLRQAGGVWQFRHALLRDRLATTAGKEQPK